MIKIKHLETGRIFDFDEVSNYLKEYETFRFGYYHPELERSLLYDIKREDIFNKDKIEVFSTQEWFTIDELRTLKDGFVTEDLIKKINRYIREIQENDYLNRMIW